MPPPKRIEMGHFTGFLVDGMIRRVGVHDPCEQAELILQAALDLAIAIAVHYPSCSPVYPPCSLAASCCTHQVSIFRSVRTVRLHLPRSVSQTLSVLRLIGISRATVRRGRWAAR